MKFKRPDLLKLLEGKPDISVNGITREDLIFNFFDSNLGEVSTLIIKYNGKLYAAEVSKNGVDHNIHINGNYWIDSPIECQEVVAQTRVEYVTDYVPSEEANNELD